jgi:hypothetical protein
MKELRREDGEASYTPFWMEADGEQQARGVSKMKGNGSTGESRVNCSISLGRGRLSRIGTSGITQNCTGSSFAWSWQIPGGLDDARIMRASGLGSGTVSLLGHMSGFPVTDSFFQWFSHDKTAILSGRHNVHLTLQEACLS